MDIERLYRINRTSEDYQVVTRALAPALPGQVRSRWSRWGALAGLPVIAILLGAGAALILRGLPPELYRLAASAGLWGAAVTAVLVVFLMRGGATPHPQPAAGRGRFLAAAQLEITPEGIIERGPGWQCGFMWQAIIDLQVLKTGYLLRTDAAEGVFMPFSAFAHGRDRMEFEEAVRAGLSGQSAPGEEDVFDRVQERARQTTPSKVAYKKRATIVTRLVFSLQMPLEEPKLVWIITHEHVFGLLIVIEHHLVGLSTDA